jgi:hypothetical protein
MKIKILLCVISVFCAGFPAKAIEQSPLVGSSVLESSRVLKSTPGALISFQAYNSSGSQQFILIIDAASVPSNGAVTLLCPPIPVPALTTVTLPITVAIRATNGIVVANSSTGFVSGSAVLTIGSADCFFKAQIL